MFIRVEIWTVGRTNNGIAALLRLPSSARCVPVYVEQHEAQTILAALSGAKESPPRLNEMTGALIRALAVRLESIEIFRGASPGSYRSVAHFSSADKRFTLDARVPDALALALRSAAPIFLDDSIAEEEAIGVTMTESEEGTSSQLARLRRELERRVVEEDYEQAALLRDRIGQIEGRMRTGTE